MRRIKDIFALFSGYDMATDQFAGLSIIYFKDFIMDIQPYEAAVILIRAIGQAVLTTMITDCIVFMDLVFLHRPLWH